tara:strand:- start:1680 stop:1958 length:279 start_codon:yes stop_codon:yes gene_type:complete
MAQVQYYGLSDIMEIDMEKPEPTGWEQQELIGITADASMKTMTQRTMLRINLQKQQKEAEEQITVLEGKLDRTKEYLAKIEGGLDVLDELDK